MANWHERFPKVKAVDDLKFIALKLKLVAATTGLDFEPRERRDLNHNHVQSNHVAIAFCLRTFEIHLSIEQGYIANKMPSSSPSSSQQSSLYQFYPRISSNEANLITPSHVLQPSTLNNLNIPRDSRMSIKRPLQMKDLELSITSLAKKRKQSPFERETIGLVLDEIPPFRRQIPQTFSRSLLARSLQGQQGNLSKRIFTSEFRLKFSLLHRRSQTLFLSSY
jgi:hypothetical protein